MDATNILCEIGDIIKSKKAAGQDKDLAVLPILQKTLEVKNAKKNS